jgi:hypothetical protein
MELKEGWLLPATSRQGKTMSAGMFIRVIVAIVMESMK